VYTLDDELHFSGCEISVLDQSAGRLRFWRVLVAVRLFISVCNSMMNSTVYILNHIFDFSIRGNELFSVPWRWLYYDSCGENCGDIL